jgi:hypothetical protein
MSAVAVQIQGIDVKHTVINQKVEHEITTKEVYRDGACRHDAVMFGLLNAALSGRAPDEPASDGAVPATDPAPGP